MLNSVVQREMSYHSGQVSVIVDRNSIRRLQEWPPERDRRGRQWPRYAPCLLHRAFCRCAPVNLTVSADNERRAQQETCYWRRRRRVSRSAVRLQTIGGQVMMCWSQDRRHAGLRWRRRFGATVTRASAGDSHTTPEYPTRAYWMPLLCSASCSAAIVAGARLRARAFAGDSYQIAQRLDGRTSDNIFRVAVEVVIMDMAAAR
jgi:hypothetical protein